MARGAASAQRKQRPKPDPKRSKSAPAWEEQLFFSRLRRHAKVIYVLLAMVFVFSFVLLGVGSGSNGISDALQSFFGQNSGSSLGSQINDKQQAVDAAAEERQPLPRPRRPLPERQPGGEGARHPAQGPPGRAEEHRRPDQDRLRSTAARPAARATTTATCFAVYSQNVTTPPGLDTSSQIGQALTSDPYSQALQTQLNDAYTKVITAYQKVAGRLQAGGPGREGHLERAERAAAVGLGRPERERRRHRDHRLPALPEGGARQPERRGGQADARAAPGVGSRSPRVRLPRPTGTRTDELRHQHRAALRRRLRRSRSRARSTSTRRRSSSSSCWT